MREIIKKDLSFRDVKYLKYRKNGQNKAYREILLDNKIIVFIGNPQCTTSILKLLEETFSLNSKKHTQQWDVEYEIPFNSSLTNSFNDFKGCLSEFEYRYRQDINWNISDSKRLVLRKQGSRIIVSFSHLDDNEERCYSDKCQDLMKLGPCFGELIDCSVYQEIVRTHNVSPEEESDQLVLLPDGTGATNIIRGFLVDKKLNNTIVEEKILHIFNRIMAPDFKAKRLMIQQDSKSKIWEVFLVPANGQNKVPLESIGNAAKTILLILVQLFLDKNGSLKTQDNKHYVFIFDEIDNNLDLQLQHRLFSYLYNHIKRRDAQLFLTTHSPFAMRSFFENDDITLYHVTYDENNDIQTTNIADISQFLNVIHDLGFELSSIFLANGIIWVEGPSDRIYIKAWLELFGKNQGRVFTEGSDYQFAYTGGRMLAHYTAQNIGADVDGLVNILKMSSNAVVIMDSDKSKEDDSLVDYKVKIIESAKKSNILYWVTKGREIENYLTPIILNKAYAKEHKIQQLKNIGQYERFSNAIKELDANYEDHKVKGAKKIADIIAKEPKGDCSVLEVLDLKEKIQRLYEQIEKWNS